VATRIGAGNGGTESGGGGNGVIGWGEGRPGAKKQVNSPGPAPSASKPGQKEDKPVRNVPRIQRPCSSGRF